MGTAKLLRRVLPENGWAKSKSLKQSESWWSCGKKKFWTGNKMETIELSQHLPSYLFLNKSLSFWASVPFLPPTLPSFLSSMSGKFEDWTGCSQGSFYVQHFMHLGEQSSISKICFFQDFICMPLHCGLTFIKLFLPIGFLPIGFLLLLFFLGPGVPEVKGGDFQYFLMVKSLESIFSC